MEKELIYGEGWNLKNGTLTVCDQGIMERAVDRYLAELSEDDGY